MEDKTIAIDFDGVINRYSPGWQDGSIYDEHGEGVGGALRELNKKSSYQFVVKFSSTSLRAK